MVRKWRFCAARVILAFLVIGLACGSAVPAVFGQAMTEFAGMGALRAGAMGTGAGLSAGMGNDAVRRSYGMMMNAQQKALGAAKGAIAEQTKAIEQYWNYGIQAEAQKKWAAAEQAYKYALQTISARDGQKSTTNVPVLERLVSINKAEKKVDQAIDFQKMIVNLFQGEKKPDYKSLVKSRQELSNLFVQKQDYKNAEPILRDTVAMCDSSHNVSNDQRTVILRLYGSVLRKLNKNAEADNVDAAVKNPSLNPLTSPPVKAVAPISEPPPQANQQPVQAPYMQEQQPPVEPLPTVQHTIRHDSEPLSNSPVVSPSSPVRAEQIPANASVPSVTSQPSKLPSVIGKEKAQQSVQTKESVQVEKLSPEPLVKDETTAKQTTTLEKTTEETQSVTSEKTAPREEKDKSTTLEKVTSEESAKQSTTVETVTPPVPNQNTPVETTQVQEAVKQSTTGENATVQEESKQTTTVETPQVETKQSTTSENATVEETTRQSATQELAQPQEAGSQETKLEKTTTQETSKQLTKESVNQSTDQLTTQSASPDKIVSPKIHSQTTGVESKTESETKSAVTSETSKAADAQPVNLETQKATDK
jgi:hypothetical protein